MRAATIVNGSLVIADRPTPVAGPGDVLIEIASAGINAADLLQLLGFYPAPAGSPADIPGLEIAGHVVAVGPQVDSELLRELNKFCSGMAAREKALTLRPRNLERPVLPPPRLPGLSCLMPIPFPPIKLLS